MKAVERTRLFPIIILALAVFAVLRLTNVWIGFGAAEAQTGLLNGETSMSSDKAMREASPPEISAGEVERRILENLAARRAALEAREAEFAAREAVVIVAEQRLDEKIAAFEEERAALVAMREEQEADNSEDIASIVSAYERMKAKDAAVIFNALDETILVPLAGGMRTQALAGVLAEMQPDKARRLTTLLAERSHIDQSNAIATDGGL